MNKIKKIIGMLLFLHLICFGLAQEYKIIVNSDNPTNSITGDKLDKLFLKKVSKWDDGSKINPVNLAKNSTIRENFSKNIHGKHVNAVNVYWQKQIFTGKGVPPVEKKTNRAVIEYVKNNPGAIGYVSSSTSTTGVKVIKVVN